VLDVYGSLHYAGARTLQHRLPDPNGSEHPAVVLRMRGRAMLGATFFAVVAAYAEQLDAVGGRLYITGIDPALMAQARRTLIVEEDGPIRLYGSQPVVGESSLEATRDAQSWIAQHSREP
jgi:sulfate permease, SulP family